MTLTEIREIEPVVLENMIRQALAQTFKEIQPQPIERYERNE